jgi:hypothetical protein
MCLSLACAAGGEGGTSCLLPFPGHPGLSQSSCGGFFMPSGPETSPDYFTRFGAASYRSWPHSSFFACTVDARTSPE